MEKLKLLLVDDQKIFTESLKTFLKNYADDMEVTGIAANGKEACDFVDNNPVDIVLMDVNMPVMNGVEAVKIIKTAHPDVKIIMLSTYDEDDYVRESLLAGSSGYLLKDLSPTELIISIRGLKAGIMQISPSIAQKMIKNTYIGEKTENSDEEEKISEEVSKKFEWLNTLTKREREIFTLIATGHDNNEIAEELNLALQTVRNQVSTIYSKLGVKDRFEIIKLANKI